MTTNTAAAPLSSLAVAVAAQLSTTCWISARAPASLDRETASRLDPEVLAAAHEELVTAKLASMTTSRLGSRLYRLTAPSALQRCADASLGDPPVRPCHRARILRTCSCHRAGKGREVACLAAFRVSRTERPRKGESCSCFCHRRADGDTVDWDLVSRAALDLSETLANALGRLCADGPGGPPVAEKIGRRQSRPGAAYRALVKRGLATCDGGVYAASPAGRDHARAQGWIVLGS